MLKNDRSFDDQRGGARSNDAFFKLSDDMKKLMHEHCSTFEYLESHYKFNHSKLKYSTDSSLNLKIMFSKFCEYYKRVTERNSVPIGKSTYQKYFNHFVDFTFDMPRIDVCNDCLILKRDNPVEDEAIHKSKYENHAKMKKEMLSYDDTLCFEFDFGQNLPLPKIPVNVQFYLRLIWYTIFNVHVYVKNGIDKSYMFTFLEGYTKKGENT